MKQYFLTLAAAAALLCGALPLQAGTLGPALQQATESSDPEVRLPVIIRFVNQVDVEAVRAEVRRTARQLYPDDAGKRKKERRKLKRKMLVKNLKAVARDSKKQVRRFLKAYGEKSKLKLLWSQNSVAAVIPVYLLDELVAQDYVDRIVLDATIQAPGTGTPPAAPTYWNLDVTGVHTLWNGGNTGQDVVVATLDTGVDATHPDLGPRWRGGTNSWFDPYGQHGSPADTHGHGTQVMGLIVGGAAGGYQVGMAPDSQWIAAKIFDDSDEATLSAIHEAFQWVLDPDGNPNTDDAPDIVNNSWDLASTVNQCVQEFAPDIALLKAADIAVVFAGGNYGPGGDSSVSPANDPAVLSVGAVDSTLAVDILSGRGANACDGGVYPHLVAPGDSVLTTDRMPGFYNVVAGTSFAVAHLAGGMAVLKSAFPDASATELEVSLISTATDLGAWGADNDYGYGLMDLVAANDHLASILGGGDPGSLQLSNISYSIDENAASLSVTITRSGGSAGEVSVDFSTADDTALAGQDYTAASGTLVFADGEMSRNFNVTILDDSLYEGNEGFSVVLDNVLGGASLGTPDSAYVTILEDDQVPDADGDGVSDVLDQCPGTPAGESIDGNGCSASQLDSDNDGVSDDLDQCPDTPAGESADGNGCSVSQLDSDGDGVNDGVDQCPGTPAGAAVDTNGCSASQSDSDGDGVSDAIDQCPDTPAGASVNSNGCSPGQLDSDGDGVNDAVDQCSGTPAGTAVDAVGCPLPVGPVDADGDGHAADIDCNDDDNSVHPGAAEVKHDGIDQDCNGYDLTVEITKATYVTRQNKPVVYATSALNGSAALKVTYHGAAGESLTKNMSWNSRKSRWQKAIKNFTSKFGFTPASVTVSGPEGEATAGL